MKVQNLNSNRFIKNWKSKEFSSRESRQANKIRTYFNKIICYINEHQFIDSVTYRLCVIMR